MRKTTLNKRVENVKVRNEPAGGDIYIMSRSVPSDDGEPVSVAIFVPFYRTREYAAQKLRWARRDLGRIVDIAKAAE